MGALVLIGGGVRSGKSAFAVRWALGRSDRRAFIATARAYDDEMRARIAAHQRERGDAFDTVEAPTDLAGALNRCAGAGAVVVDCLTLWLSNLLLDDVDDGAIATRLDEVIGGIDRLAGDVAVVTNEVGMGIVPSSALGRRFRDVAGRAHQRLAARAGAVYFAAMGLMLQLTPGPVRVVGHPDG